MTFFGDDDSLSPVVFLADTWAEFAIRNADDARVQRDRFNSLDRAYERGDEYVDSAMLMRQFKKMWVAECQFVWSADAAQQWLFAALSAMGEAFERDHELRRLRDALEHLQGADFSGGRATAVKQRDWALRELGHISIGNYYGSDRAFRDLDVQRVQTFIGDAARKLRAAVGEVEDLDA